MEEKSFEKQNKPKQWTLCWEEMLKVSPVMRSLICNQRNARTLLLGLVEELCQIKKGKMKDPLYVLKILKSAIWAFFFFLNFF